IFKNSRTGNIYRYGEEQQHDKPDSVMYADFMLEKSWFAIMDSGHAHKFDFNEAISFMVNCQDQSEIDYYWNKLTADPASEQCGWLKDKFGLSWQITPSAMNDMLSNGTAEQVDRVTQAFLPMKKLEIAPLEKAFKGL
ncbi:MAG: VOC family protein, partial [Sphingobacteriales bacterium]